MELYTDDLLLRTVTPDDVNEVARMWEFDKGGVPPDEAQNAIKRMQANHKKNMPGRIHHLCLAVFEQGHNAIIGWCGLDGTISSEKLWLFYMIDKRCRNRGYATQCASKLLSYAFEDAGVPHINGSCDIKNAASFRVMEKTGMKQIASENADEFAFFINQETYRQKLEAQKHAPA
jgi:RimJ/RimL family protein N-acetyltransferase